MSKKSLEYTYERDETFQLLSWWKKDAVRDAKVMVVGAGALGNEVLKNLALLNVGHILIVDYDTIEYANLCRSVLFREQDCVGDKLKAQIAAERIKEMNPDIKIMVINGDISCDVGYGVTRRMDVVIGCLDNRLARRNINRACHHVQKVWIDGAIENLLGKAATYIPGISCYECNLTENDQNIIKIQTGCPDIAKRNLAYGRIPTTPISSSIIAAIQVQEALKVIHGYNNKLLADKFLYYEGMNNEIGLYETTGLSNDCLSHYTYEPIIQAKELRASSTVKQALDWLQEYFSDSDVAIKLDHRLVLEISPESNGEKSIPLIIPFPHLSDSITAKYKNTPDEKVFVTDTDILDNTFQYTELTLGEVGIPPLHIMTVISGNKYFIELTGDEQFLNFQ